MTRSTAARSWTLRTVIISVTILAAACGGGASNGLELAAVDDASLPARVDTKAQPTVAGQAITDFGLELFTTERAQGDVENLSISPASIAVALAMTEPGASGEGRTQLHDVLGIDDPKSFHDSMNAFDRSLNGRTTFDLPEGMEDPGDMTIRLVNSAYLQHDYSFEPDYLNTIGTNYGAALRTVDFKSNADGVRADINDWVEEQTENRIVELIPANSLDGSTRMVLVNALYLDAGWTLDFPDENTEPHDFTTLDGGTVEVDMMFDEGGSASRGRHWVGASKRLDGDLVFQVVLPAEGKFDEISESLLEIFSEVEGGDELLGKFGLPRFETRSAVELVASLNSMGLTKIFGTGNLLGIADDPKLKVDEILHQTYIGVDENGVEAAAATAMEFVEVGGVIGATKVDVIVDRPFYYRVFDEKTKATLMIGQVVDPMAG